MASSAKSHERPATQGPAGVAELFDAHWTWMVRLATLITGRRAIAEDVVAQVFSDLTERPREMESARAYLRTAVVNRCHTHHRRAWREIEQTVDHERTVLPSTDAVEVWEALSRLSRRARTVIVLRYWEDLPIDEIAQMMGTRPGTVSSLLHRAVKQLRKELEP